MNNKLIVFSLIFIFIGLGVFYKAYLIYSESKILQDTGLSAQGEVLKIVTEKIQESDGGTNTVYYPIVRFEARDKQTIEFKSNLVKSSLTFYHVGQKVKVVYPPENPQKARIDSFSNLWLGPILMAVIAALLGAIGMLLIYYFIIAPNLNENSLKVHGQLIEAKIVKISSKGYPPYNILAEWTHPITRKKCYFLSADLPTDPKEKLRKGTITVLVDFKNPKRYFIDTSFLTH
ncbi:hypothetical protein COT42_01110 [Candidatus Saganbacteria bacterium CG08_land_8_20_14_0_20_45_16]|uniref:DUF3592 domain-containing protein n=1 Tax=Candidatus Saganbacteria bacterium CG08_land_8_20_14_0_20_45_16 TaxID=2014293 RepID=A0A2H0Y1E7_UNCSA|nr:MAG: hypothetical protein COT42_01110 [Candidatus Saganbacteria bacterium CG08_land_8_20_14_0_20_45_16]